MTQVKLPNTFEKFRHKTFFYNKTKRVFFAMRVPGGCGYYQDSRNLGKVKRLTATGKIAFATMGST